MQVQAMNKSQMAAHFNVSIKVLNTWLKKHGKKVPTPSGYTYTPKQVAIIFKLLCEE